MPIRCIGVTQWCNAAFSDRGALHRPVRPVGAGEKQSVDGKNKLCVTRPSMAKRQYSARQTVNKHYLTKMAYR